MEGVITRSQQAGFNLLYSTFGAGIPNFQIDGPNETVT